MGLSLYFNGLRFGVVNVESCSQIGSLAVNLNVIAEKLKRQSRDNFKGQRSDL